MDESPGEHFAQAADGRDRADAIADIAELDEKDLTYGFAGEERAADAKNLDRLGLGNDVVDLLREPRVMIRVAIAKKRPPLPAERRFIVMVGRLRPTPRAHDAPAEREA